jgi:hypothetical protein
VISTSSYAPRSDSLLKRGLADDDQAALMDDDTNELLQRTIMDDRADGTEDSLAGVGRLFDVLRQTARRATNAAVDAVRTQAIEVLDGYRQELRRAMAVYVLYRAVLLFTWSAATCAALALFLAWWATHRVVAALLVAAGFLVLAGGSALAVRNLTRRRGSNR